MRNTWIRQTASSFFMDLNTPIVNIHYEKYIAHSHELLKRIGVIFSRALV